MTGTRPTRRSIVLLGASFAFVGGIAFAPPAVAQPGFVVGDPIPVTYPECFGRTYMGHRPTLDGWVAGASQSVVYATGGITYGTSGDDVIVGTPDADTIFGLGGRDKICGNGGDDHLYGEGDVDEIDGGSGADLLKGGDGSDRLFGQEGRDEIWGDDVGGAQGDDYLYGHGAVDTLYCVGGEDVANGGQAVDLPATGHGCETYDDH